MSCLEHVLNTGGRLSGIREIRCSFQGHVLYTNLNTQFHRHCISSDCIGQRARMGNAGEIRKTRINIEDSQCPRGFFLARPAGLEPAAFGLEIRCSIQLSYGRVRASLKGLLILIKS